MYGISSHLKWFFKPKLKLKFFYWIDTQDEGSSSSDTASSRHEKSSAEVEKPVGAGEGPQVGESAAKFKQVEIPGKGQGLVATARLPVGTIVIQESPIFTAKETLREDPLTSVFFIKGSHSLFFIEKSASFFWHVKGSQNKKSSHSLFFLHFCHQLHWGILSVCFIRDKAISKLQGDSYLVLGVLQPLSLANALIDSKILLTTYQSIGGFTFAYQVPWFMAYFFKNKYK